MRLSLSIPPDLASVWSAEGPNRFVAGEPDRQATLSFGALTLLPDDVPAWVERTLRVDSPAGAAIERGGLVERTTASGWRFRIVDARVIVASKPIEVRMAALYRFFEHTGAALLRIPGADPDPERARQAIEIFETGAPDLSSSIAGLHQLWPQS